jgi:hypothetical protein
MGMFKKLKTMTGSVDKDLLRNGLLGRGTLTAGSRCRSPSCPGWCPVRP